MAPNAFTSEAPKSSFSSPLIHPAQHRAELPIDRGVALPVGREAPELRRESLLRAMDRQVLEVRSEL